MCQFSKSKGILGNKTANSNGHLVMIWWEDLDCTEWCCDDL